MRNAKEKLAVVKKHDGPFERMCCAFGCPELGSISNSNAGPASECQWFCRFHFGETSDRWPEITRSRRLFHDNPPKAAVAAVEVTPEFIAQAQAELGRFTKSFGNIQDHKAWARKLKAREEAGEVLNDCQRDAWREALRHAAEVA